MKRDLVRTAKEIIIEGVKVGLDIAGENILGPLGWKAFKRVLSPIIKRLKKRYPALAFGVPDNKLAEEAARHAADALEQDHELRALLENNFNQLKQGQQEIIRGVQRLERTVKQTSEDIGQIVAITQEIREEMGNLRPQVTGGELPTFVNVSDFIDHSAMLARIRARRQKKQWNESVMATVFMIIGINHFIQQVLEYGNAFKMYKTKLGPFEITITAQASYENARGDLCRKYTIVQPDIWHDLHRQLAISRIACKQEGLWRDLSELERMEY